MSFVLLYYPLSCEVFMGEILTAILTERVALTGIIVAAVLTIAIMMIVVVKYGFRIKAGLKMGWPYFEMYTEKPQGMAKEEVAELLQEEVARSLETHMATFSTYKDLSFEYDGLAKQNIAHHFDEITIPPIPGSDLTQTAILSLEVRTELLIRNIENHYERFTETQADLALYIKERFSHILNIFDKFSQDKSYTIPNAYKVLTFWWSIVCPELVKMEKRKIEMLDNAKSIIEDPNWSARFDALREHHLTVVDTVTRFTDLSKAIDPTTSALLFKDVLEHVDEGDEGEV